MEIQTPYGFYFVDVGDGNQHQTGYGVYVLSTALPSGEYYPSTGIIALVGGFPSIGGPTDLYPTSESLELSCGTPGLYNPQGGTAVRRGEFLSPLGRYGNTQFWMLDAPSTSFVEVTTLSLSASASALSSALGQLIMAIDLSGIAEVTATATGDLSPHPLTGSAQAVATAAGALASLIKLTADAEIGATASGSPDVLVAIAGAAAALASASASLGQSFLLSGNAAALATAAGAITQQLGVIGAAAGRAGATGALDVEGQELALASSAAAAATATAALSGVTHLAGAAAAQGTGAAVLAQDKPLGGAATGRATATGSLGAVSNLEGDAEALATLTGALDQSLAVAGAAQAVATAAGSLSQTLAMQGAASSKSSATGSLGVAETITGGITYAVNLDTGTVTTWNNCAFERLVTAHGKLYGLLAGVLYRIEGDTDPGSIEIASQVRFAQSNFGSTTLNRLYKVYITSREIEQAEVTPIYDETTSLSYTSIPDLLSGMITHRTNIGRGNRWRTLGLQVANKQGGQLDIGGLELLIQPLVPRIP